MRPTPTPGVTFREAHFRDGAGGREFSSRGSKRTRPLSDRTSEGTEPAQLFIEIQGRNGQPETLKALQAVAATYQVLAPKGVRVGA